MIICVDTLKQGSCPSETIDKGYRCVQSCYQRILNWSCAD